MLLRDRSLTRAAPFGATTGCCLGLEWFPAMAPNHAVETLGSRRLRWSWVLEAFYRVNRVAFLRWCRASASAISRSTSAAKGMPQCSHILGYMLIDVKPGMVLISLM